MARQKLTEEEKAERRAEKKQRQEIDQIENNLKNQLKDLRSGYLNEPNYLFNVGDRVQIGAIDKSVITEVIDGGKIYKVHQWIKAKNSRQQDSERDSYSCWVSVRPYVENPEPKEKSLSYSNKYRHISYMNQSVDSLFSYRYGSYAGIETEPDYQRDLVWDLEDKVSLIHSIFEQIDIGNFTFIKRPFAVGQKGYEILDGKQRLNAIVEFYEDRFTYMGKTYSELHWIDQAHFRNCPISVGMTDPMTDKEKYDYFLRLNTGGKPQDPKHVEYVRNLLKGS